MAAINPTKRIDRNSRLWITTATYVYELLKDKTDVYGFITIEGLRLQMQQEQNSWDEFDRIALLEQQQAA